jgi:hypothetical protein
MYRWAIAGCKGCRGCLGREKDACGVLVAYAVSSLHLELSRMVYQIRAGIADVLKKQISVQQVNIRVEVQAAVAGAERHVTRLPVWLSTLWLLPATAGFAWCIVKLQHRRVLDQ